MGTLAVLVKLADASSSMEISDPKLAGDFLTRYADHLGRNGTQHLPASPGTPAAVPRIGAVWTGQGGTYAGLCRGVDGKPDYHLFVHAAEQESIKWQAALDWAKGLSADGYTDFALPTRKEQAVLFGNVPELFKPQWYWSCEQHAEYSDWAWLQDFTSGNQYGDRKGDDYRARAVRRLIIQ